MSLLRVDRFILKPDWTIGKLFVNDILDGYTVEDEIRNIKVPGETAIPYGNYKLGYRFSPKFSKSFLWSDTSKLLIEPKEKIKYPNIIDWREHDLIWIKDVPKFEYVLLHFGNTDLDTEGCLIVGKAIGVIGGREGVINSRAYYKILYPKIYPLIKQGGQEVEYRKS